MAAEGERGRGDDVVFVGGTGRSGTHVIGRLLGHHARYADIPIEARFHCNKRGMPDLLEGRVTLGGFLTKLREFWWHRVRVDDEPRGLYNLMTRRSFDEAVAAFERSYHDDPVAACHGLFVDLLWPWADLRGRPGLVEMSSHNVREAQALRRLFPDARFIHTVRDGRDAASSVTTKTWGPDEVVAAIGWWVDRLRAIDEGVSAEEDGTRFAIPAERMHVLVLDELIGGDREGEYERLRAFLGVDDDEAMRGFFARMTSESAHLGRWRESVGAVGRVRVQRRYERALEELEREGNHVARPLIEVYEKRG